MNATALQILQEDLERLVLRQPAVVERRLARAVLNAETYDELPSSSLHAPVLIYGLPRTGSTLLHELLAMTPELQAPTYAEARWPLVRSLAAEHEAAAFFDYTMAATRKLLAIHRMSLDGPEECRVLLEPTFMSMSYATEYPVPTYAAWCDHTPAAGAAWASLRNVLGAMDPDARWVLKDVSHTGQLLYILTAMPTMQVVWLHRDPIEALASTCSLVERLWMISVLSPLDLSGLGSWVLERYRSGFHRDLTMAPESTTHVRYTDLVGAPATIVDRLGFTVLDDMARPPEPEPHQYSLERYGLSVGAVREAFEGYEIEEYCS